MNRFVTPSSCIAVMTAYSLGASQAIEYLSHYMNTFGMTCEESAEVLVGLCPEDKTHKEAFI